MSEREPSSLTEEQIPSERIGITYHGVLAERMDWKRDILGQFEQLADLRTAVEITSSDNPEEFDVVGLGDTLALRKVGNIQDLFSRRQNPKKFLAVQTNLSTARATITIDDQGITSESLKQGRKFDGDEFTQKVNKLVKEGLRSVLSTEKKHQLRTSLTLEAGMSSPLLFAIPGLIFVIEQIGNSANSDIMSILVGLGSTLGGAGIGERFGISIIEKTEDKLLNESNFVYVLDEFEDISHSPKHLSDLIQGRRFLATDKNKIVTLKAE